MNQTNKYCMFCMQANSLDNNVCAHCGREQQAANVFPHHLLPGTVLSGKFLIGSVLGEGGFGITYIGRDINLDMRIAIKEYYQSGLVNRNHTHSNRITANTGEPEAIFKKGKERFLKEARILASLSSEQGIVGVRDFFTENNTAYIIMDYLDGITLKTYLEQNGNMSMAQVLELIKPVMRVLKRIHDQGLIHRDISPDNIMLMKDGSLKLLDFGAARNVTGLDNKSLSVTLKLGYAPEEQYRSKGNQGPWTDVYALSATMYKCITGITPEDAMQRVFGDDIKSPSELGAVISPEQETVLLKGMAILQKNRVQDIDCLWEAFFGTSIQETTNTTPPVVSSGFVSETGNHTVSAGTPDESNQTVMATDDNNIEQPNHQYDIGTPAMMAQVDPQQEISPVSEPKIERRKKKKSRKILALLVAGLGALLLIVTVIVWNVMGTMNNVTIGDQVVKNDAEAVSFSEAPDITELEQLKDMPNLTRLSLYYTEGLDNEALQIVGQLTNLEELNLGYRYSSIDLPDDKPSPDLSLLKDLKNLRELGIYCLSITDFSELKELTALRALRIYQSAEDISTMTGLTKLDCLDLSENNISDLSPLKDCTALTSIYVSYNQLTSLSGLEGCKSLMTVDVSGNKLSDISAIQNCEKIIYFHAAENQLTDVSILGELLTLYGIDIRDNMITDISALSKCEKLQKIQADGNQISDLPVLAASQKLNYLSIGENKLTNLDALSENIYLEKIIAPNNQIVSIEGLINCTQLAEVNFNNNQISDIAVLAKSGEKLEKLYLENNAVSDISSLKGAAALTFLALDSNKIADLTPLKESVNLESLFLHDNELTGIQDLSALNQLQYLDLSNNQLTSAAGLPEYTGDTSLGLYLDLSGNQITDISSLPNPQYAALYLDGNPLKDYAKIKDLKFKFLTLTYQDGIDYNPLKEAVGQKTVYAIDTPLDKQVDLKNDLKEGSVTVNYVTAEEIRDYKQSKRDELTGVNQTEEAAEAEAAAEDPTALASEAEASEAEATEV